MATELNDAPADTADKGADKDAAPKWSPQIIVAIVSVIGGVLGAFIGILPQLRSHDANTIGRLEQQVSQLKLNLRGDPKESPPPQTPKLQITGTVMDASGKRPLGWAEVFLVPQDKPKHIGTTGPDGSFRFPDVPNQRYRIVVRDSVSGKMTVGDMDEDGHVTKLAGAIVTYRVEK